MTKKYRKQDTTDWGYLTTVPFPQKQTADMVAADYKGKYEEVLVEKTPSGYVVKFRGPK